jgi:RimJ/RimL family protein N-acetyltransferase
MLRTSTLGTLLTLLVACSEPSPWPASPLVPVPEPVPDADYPQTRAEALEAIAGHYAHFDVVAYEDDSTRTPMRTFIVSYGFTDFEIVGDGLRQTDRFLFAEYVLNQRFVETSFSEAAVEAIEPRVQDVQLSLDEGLWKVYRPESPVLLGIRGDPEQPLPRDPDDPDIFDADGDGQPGVTAKLRIGGFIDGEIYLTRREIYRDHLTLHPDGRLIGWVEDLSEQFVIDANMKILKQPSNNVQAPDPGLNPIVLTPIAPELDSREELEAARDELFPPAPRFE